MAEILAYRIEFIQNNTYGTFVSGDVLEIYVDDAAITTTPSSSLGESTTGMKVYKNGVLIGSGPLISFDPSIIGFTNYGLSFCSTTYLISGNWTQIFFPYGGYIIYPDANECSLTPTVCDLQVIGTPDITGSTSIDTADGSFTIVGQSTNAPIEYKLGSDFTYGDGTAQSDGEFIDLLAGDYRVYLRDSKNCKANILVTIPVGNPYGERFRLEYYDLNGWRTKISIVKKNYAGSVAEYCASGDPIMISLRGEGSLNKFEPVLSSEAIVSMTSETDSEFLELYTNDPSLYRVVYYKDFGSGYETIWTGKVLPQQYMEQYKAAPYYVTFSASDSLSQLKESFLIQKDGQQYYGTVSLIKLVAFLLRSIGFGLNIRVGCNVYALDMNQTATDDPFDQAHIDYECFYLAEEFPTYDFVLREVLKPFGLRLVQWENKWNIIRIEEMISSFDYREFDQYGDYVSNGTYDPLVDITYPSGTQEAILTEADHNLEIKPGYGKLKVNYKLGLKPNILRNGNFSLKSVYQSDGTYKFEVNKYGWTLVNAGYPAQEDYEVVEGKNIAYRIQGYAEMLDNTNAGNSYLQSDVYSVAMATNNQLKLSIKYKILTQTQIVFDEVFYVQVPYTKLRVRVKYGSLYLRTDGTWTSSENIMTFFVTEYNKFVNLEILAKQPLSGTPTIGMDLDVRVYHAYTFHSQFQSLADLRAFPTYDSGTSARIIPIGYKTELRDDFSSPSKLYFYELRESSAAESGYDVVEPDDTSGSNVVRWVLYQTVDVGVIQTTFSMSLDYVSLNFLVDGAEAFDAIVRTVTGESNNNNEIEQELIIGSSGNLIVTETYFGINGIQLFNYNPPPATISILSKSILSSDLIYTGFLRDSTGVGYEFWARDGVTESDKLHGLLLRQYSGQYNRSWRLLRGTFKSVNTYFGLINVAREVNDNNRIYLPIALTLNDKRCSYNVELLELNNSVTASGSDGSGEAPFSSGFSSGFGAASFN